MSDSQNKHYDVGIAGVWFGGNYGSVLTYFALREVILNMGYSVAMIDKPGANHNDPEKSPKIHSRVFAREHGYDVLPVFKLQDLEGLNEYCDRFVLGSDQVWNYGVGGGPGFGSLMYLGFADETKTLTAYAPSFGHPSSHTPIEALSRITGYLQRIDHVSVRERDGIDILKNEFGVHGTQVLDPIYLLESSVYEGLIDPADTADLPEKYLLAYVLGKGGGTFDLDSHTIKFLKEQAERKGLSLIVLADARKAMPDERRLEELRHELGAYAIEQCNSISQWLGYIKNSSSYITDSFHGAGFGILFERQMLILGNRARGISRFNSIVDMLKLQDVFACSLKDLSRKAKSDPSIDYSYVHEVLAMEKARSIAWLESALATMRPQPNSVATLPNKECCGCMACVNACPTDCISMVPDVQENCLYPSIDEDVCIHCGKCVKACPAKNMMLDKEEEARLYAAYTTDDVRMISSSGGIFSLVADHVLDEGGVVFGAAYDDDFVLHQVAARTKEELAPLRASKYVQSQADMTYREAMDVLKAGKPVLYVGCPCQIAGLNSFLGRAYDNLYTIDLLCHGGPTPYSFARYLEEVHAGKKVTYVGFRDKDYFGWSTEMTVKYADGQVYRKKRNEDLYYRAFLPCLSVRPHCQVCNYSRLPRQGDLTLGDFWGVSKYDESLTDGNGTSIVSINSDKGQALYEAIGPRLKVSEPIEREWVLTHGQPYAKPFKNNPRRYRFQRLLEQGTFKAALECCASNTFDYFFLGASPNSYGEMLEQYALQRAAAKLGYTVLMGFEPREERYRKGNITPLRYRLIEFANWNYPAVSKQRNISGQRTLNTLVHGFMSSGKLAYADDICRYKNGVFCYETDVLAHGGAPSIMLLEEDDWNRISAQSGSPVSNQPFSAVYMNDAKAAKPISKELNTIDLSGDMPLADWVGHMMAAQVVVTDRIDGALVCAALGKPAVVVSSSNSDQLSQDLQKSGLNVQLAQQDALDACRSLDDLGAISNPVEIAGDPSITCELLAQCLRAHYNEQLFVDHNKRVKDNLRKVKKKLGSIYRKALGKN